MSHPPEVGGCAMAFGCSYTHQLRHLRDRTMMWSRRKSFRPGKPDTSRKPRRRLLEVELLESRTVPSTTLVVTNTNNQGNGSLRKAIADANGLPAAETVNINFNIPTS